MLSAGMRMSIGRRHRKATGARAVRTQCRRAHERHERTPAWAGVRVEG